MDTNSKIFALSDLAVAAQAKIQVAYPDMDPLIGINRSLRESGFPVDLMTIDNLKSRKRIILMIHDDTPTQVGIQLSTIEQAPNTQFEYWVYDQVSAATFEKWILDYFLD